MRMPSSWPHDDCAPEAAPTPRARGSTKEDRADRRQPPHGGNGNARPKNDSCQRPPQLPPECSSATTPGEDQASGCNLYFRRCHLLATHQEHNGSSYCVGKNRCLATRRGAYDVSRCRSFRCIPFVCCSRGCYFLICVREIFRCELSHAIAWGIGPRVRTNHCGSLCLVGRFLERILT